LPRITLAAFSLVRGLPALERLRSSSTSRIPVNNNACTFRLTKGCVTHPCPASPDVQLPRTSTLPETVLAG